MVDDHVVGWDQLYRCNTVIFGIVCGCMHSGGVLSDAGGFRRGGVLSFRLDNKGPVRIDEDWPQVADPGQSFGF
jgi:hypothetical protein